MAVSDPLLAEDEEEDLAFGGGEDIGQWGEGSQLWCTPFLTQVCTCVIDGLGL